MMDNPRILFFTESEPIFYSFRKIIKLFALEYKIEIQPDLNELNSVRGVIVLFCPLVSNNSKRNLFLVKKTVLKSGFEPVVLDDQLIPLLTYISLISNPRVTSLFKTYEWCDSIFHSLKHSRPRTGAQEVLDIISAHSQLEKVYKEKCKQEIAWLNRIAEEGEDVLESESGKGIREKYREKIKTLKEIIPSIKESKK